MTRKDDLKIIFHKITSSYFFIMLNLNILSNLYLFLGIFIIIGGLIGYYRGEGIDKILELYSFFFLVLVLVIISLTGLQYLTAIRIKKQGIKESILYTNIHNHPISYITIYSLIITIIALAAVMLFFVLLKYPNLYYLNVLYILIGTLLVSVIDKLLSKKSEIDKSKIALKRILSVVKENLIINTNYAEQNVEIFEGIGGFGDLKQLDTYFWDLIDSNIANIDLDTELLQNLLKLKHNANDINKLIQKLPKITLRKQDYYYNLKIKNKRFLKNSNLLIKKINSLII